MDVVKAFLSVPLLSAVSLGHLASGPCCQACLSQSAVRGRGGGKGGVSFDAVQLDVIKAYLSVSGTLSARFSGQLTWLSTNLPPLLSVTYISKAGIGEGWGGNEGAERGFKQEHST